MQNYPNIFDIYNRTESVTANSQIANLCKVEAYNSLTVDVVLPQFKYCLENNIKDWKYKAYRKYLVSVLSEAIIMIMED